MQRADGANPTRPAPSKHFIRQTAAMTVFPQVAAFIPPTGTSSSIHWPVSVPLPINRSVINDDTLSEHAVNPRIHTNVSRLLGSFEFHTQERSFLGT